MRTILSSNSTNCRQYRRQLELDVTRTRRNVFDELESVLENEIRNEKPAFSTILENELELDDTKRDSGFALAQESQCRRLLNK